MTRHLILVHGRAIKPPQGAMRDVAKRAVIEGLKRAGHAAAAVADGSIGFSFVYYGDINNRIEAEADPKTRAILTAKNDPGLTFEPALPIAEIEDGYRRTLAVGAFTAAAYRKVLRRADDWRFFDEAADTVGLFGQLLTFGILNTEIVLKAKADMAAYLSSKTTGSAIRDRLQAVLGPAMLAGDDICLVTHSMGCMVAYDVLWKYSFESEYQALRRAGTRVSRWVTLGCPLGEPGVRVNLRDARYGENERYPRNVDVWRNIHAKDDFVAHVETMAESFEAMRRRQLVTSIDDTGIFNCWIYKDAANGDLVSNPHDLYGYLMDHATGRAIAEWAAS